MENNYFVEQAQKIENYLNKLEQMEQEKKEITSNLKDILFNFKPIKPIKTNADNCEDVYYGCGICATETVALYDLSLDEFIYRYNYCPNCGQVVDWNE